MLPFFCLQLFWKVSFFLNVTKLFDDLYFVTRWLDRYRCALVEAILGAWITTCERWQSGAFHIDRLRTWWIVVLYSISRFGILSHLLCHRWIHSCKTLIKALSKLENELFQYDWAFSCFPTNSGTFISTDGIKLTSGNASRKSFCLLSWSFTKYWLVRPLCWLWAFFPVLSPVMLWMEEKGLPSTMAGTSMGGFGSRYSSWQSSYIR